jgi:hypothetical protein
MMFFWKQNDHQSRNAFYHHNKKVKESIAGEGASMSHESGSPIPDTPGQHTFYMQPTRVTINDHAILARQTGIPAIDETPMSSTTIRDSQVRLPPNPSARTPLEKQRMHEPPAALSHPSSSTSPQHGADPSIQVEHSNVQAAPTGRLRNKLSKSCLVTLAESPTAAEDIIRSGNDDVRPEIDPSRVVLKYRKLTDKPQLEADGSGAIASPSSERRFETPPTPDLPSLAELFMLSEPQAIGLEDGQGQQDHKDAKGHEALEEDQIEEDAVDDHPDPALRPDRGDETPVDDGADQTIHSNQAGLEANGCYRSDALNRDPGDRSLDERRSSAFEQYEESFDLLRRSSRAKRPPPYVGSRLLTRDVFFVNDQDSGNDDQEVVIEEVESAEPNPKRRRKSKKTKQLPHTSTPKASSTSKKTAKGGKKKLTRTKTPKNVRDRTQITEVTDPSVSNTDKNSDPCSALISANPTPNNSRGGPQSEEAVDKNLREPKRRLNVSFVIVQRRNAHTVKQSWPEGKLRGKSVDFVFDAVSRMCQRTNIEQINCTLFTSMTEYIAILQRGDNESFLRMERNFTKEISKAINTNANDGKEIEICIEPLGPEEMTAEDRTEVDDIEVGDW